MNSDIRDIVRWFPLCVLHSQQSKRLSKDIFYLDVLPVQEIAKLESPAQDHGSHISDDLKEILAASDE